MTGAELKTLREALGLSAAWLARSSSVKERTISYWEAGAAPVPEDVAQKIVDMKALADGLFSNFSQMLKTAQPGKTVLLRYRTNADLWESQPDFLISDLPTTFHAVILQRVKDFAESIGIKTTIIYFNKAEYHNWRGNRKDTASLRAEWADTQGRGGPC